MMRNRWLDVRHVLRFLIRLLCVLVAAVLAMPVQPAPRFDVATQPLASAEVFRGEGDAFAGTPAIWPHDRRPLAHEVALFRHTFTIERPITQARLAVFADTRYELWLDGVRLGRGPARFSRRTHEYDEYVIPTLTSGPHVIAALVQWSPNVRRSESKQPMLQLRLTQGHRTIAQTGTHWKAIRSPAWNPDASPVHAWQLIGATELLDLNQLPADWMQLDFDDTHWPAPVMQPHPTARYRPRTIPMLAEIPVHGRIAQRGVLAPGQTPVALRPDANGEQQFAFSLNERAQLILETLPVAGPSARALIQLHPSTGLQHAPLALEAELDGTLLSWTVADDWHPDVRRASVPVPPGQHTLLLRNVPVGWPVLISGIPLGPGTQVIRQGTHAGRRLLLSRPRTDDSAVAVEYTPAGYALTFRHTPSYVVLDLGRVVHGRIEAQVDGARGTIVDIGWAERPWRDGYPLPYLGSLYPEWNQTDSWVLDGTLRRISTIDARAGRYVLIAVWGDAPVQLRELRVIEERYPVNAGAMFASSDALLNAIWRVGRDTAMLNMTDAYADPWRERGQWWGDAFVVDRVNEAVFGDNALLRRGLLFMAEQVGRRPGASLSTHEDAGGYLHDYGMLWVQSVRRYVERTGDRSILPECYPAVRRLMANLAEFEHPDTGLLDIPQRRWWESALIDWTAHYSPDTPIVYGQSAPVNAMYYGALRDAAALAGWMNDLPFETAWRARAKQVRERINDSLYLPNQKRYGSSIVAGRVTSPTLFAQAWPLAYDVVPSERVTDTVNALLELISRDPTQPNVQPYGMFWVLEALGRAGRVDEGIALIKLYYGHLLARGATTWWETWDADRDHSKSLSHGWGSAPTWFLSTYAAGK
ncbi:MAG: alpha-L-rhamnosidase [Anaerolineae bacterium]|nr:alpha-L-rhamnosidase [Candidatus Roseilinea sp.]MDW8451475.1 alpha-L-rhamnosidase [Anaerolineae bacterium]